MNEKYKKSIFDRFTERQINEVIGVVILIVLISLSYLLGRAQGSSETYQTLMQSGQCQKK